MTVLEFPELKEAEERLQALQKEVFDVFQEAGPDRDMSKVKSLQGDSHDKVSWIQTKTEEVNVGKAKVEELKTLARGVSIAEQYEQYAESIADGTTEAGDGLGPRRVKSIGEQILFDPRLKQKGVEFEMPDADLKTLLTTSAGWAPQAIRTDRLVDFATRPIALLDRIPTVQTNQIAVVYMEETTFTNAAAETTEGSAKPEAALAYTERTNTIRKIAVWIPVTDEQLEDVPRMQALIDRRLSFMVRQRLASQILVGNGTPPNIRGLLNTSGIQTQAKGADPTPDAIYKAMVLVMTTGQSTPDTVVMNPLDWQDIRLLRTADGLYIWGNPSDAGPERIWGLPVVLEQGLTQNTAVVGDFGNFSELDIKKGLTVEHGYQNDDFVKNLQTIRAEMRATVVFARPSAFCQVTGV